VADAGPADAGQLLGTPGVANTLDTHGRVQQHRQRDRRVPPDQRPRLMSTPTPPGDGRRAALRWIGPSFFVASGTAYSYMSGTDNGRSFFNVAVASGSTRPSPVTPATSRTSSIRQAVTCSWRQHAELPVCGQRRRHLGRVRRGIGFEQVYVYSFNGGTRLRVQLRPQPRSHERFHRADVNAANPGSPKR